MPVGRSPLQPIPNPGEIIYARKPAKRKSTDNTGLSIDAGATTQKIISGNGGVSDSGFFGRGMRAALNAFAFTSDTFGGTNLFPPLSGGLTVDFYTTRDASKLEIFYEPPVDVVKNQNLLTNRIGIIFGADNLAELAIGVRYVPKGGDFTGLAIRWLQIIGTTSLALAQNFAPANPGFNGNPGDAGSGIGIDPTLPAYYWIVDNGNGAGENPRKLHDPWYDFPATRPAANWAYFIDGPRTARITDVVFALFKAYWVDISGSPSQDNPFFPLGGFINVSQQGVGYQLKTTG